MAAMFLSGSGRQKLNLKFPSALEQRWRRTEAAAGLPVHPSTLHHLLTLPQTAPITLQPLIVVIANFLPCKWRP